MHTRIVAVSVLAVALVGCVSPGATVPPATPGRASPVAASAPASPGHDPSCTQLDLEAPYMANAGTLPVVITVPATSSSPWSGRRDEFELQNAPCGSVGSVSIDAALVAHVDADSCYWKSSSVEAPTASHLVAQLQDQDGHDRFVATDATLGPFRATRLDLSVPADLDATMCDDGVLGLWETRTGQRTIAPGTTIQVHVAEVDGVTLVVTADYHADDATTELLAEIDAMLATLRVDM